MKKIIKYTFVLMFAGLILSCSQFKDVNGISKVENISAKINVKLNIAEGIPHPESYTYKLNNYSEKYELIRTGDASGNLDVSDVIPGIYTITVSSEVSKDGFTYNFNGSLPNTVIIENGKKLDIEVGASRAGNIILKEIYYCGSKTAKGGSYFRDQFYEIYNNSNIVQYLDKLCIGNLNPLTATANLPVWPGEDPDKFIYFTTIWQIPGNGTTYPLQPGEGAIIAQMADNHQREELNPACPVNLISAEFETYVKSTSIIKDNPAVNMGIAFWERPLPQWLVTVFGGAYAIFYPDKEIDPNDYVSPVGRTDKNYKVSVDLVVDAVELVNDETKMKLKRVPAVLDAGATTVGATYCGKSVTRKIKTTLADGRIIYMDTNNSTEDFEMTEKPIIRRNGVKIPSWNTWAN